MQSDIEKLEVSTFNDALDNFIVFAEKILQYDTAGEMKLSSLGSRSNAIQTGLMGYRNVYNKTRESLKHVEKFREVYDKCRPQFLRDLPLDDFMDWFEKTGFTIMPQPNSRNKFHLTIIYRNCVRIATRIDEEAEKFPEKKGDLLNDPAAVYPEHFMLYLFRIFYHCADETDRQTIINPQIDELEIALGLKKNEVPELGDGVFDIISAAKDVAKDIGINIPKNAQIPSGAQFKQALSQITKDKNTRETLKSVFDGVDINDPKNMPSAIGRLLSKMTEAAQETPDAVKRANEATSD
jgi:hypothetical protein